MKTEYSNSRLSYSYTPRKHGNVFAWDKPAFQSEPGKQVAENILRWEDDGGPVSGTDTPLPQVAEANTPRRMDVARQ